MNFVNMPTERFPLLCPLPKPVGKTARCNRWVRDLLWFIIVVILTCGWWLHMRQFAQQHEIVAREVVIGNDEERWRYSEEQIEQAFATHRIDTRQTYRKRLDIAIQHQENLLQKLLNLEEKVRRRSEND